MKHLGMILVGGLVVLATAQTAPYDTSILKNGNTWLYTRQESTPDGLFSNTTYSGTVEFRIDSLTLSGDSLKFNVVRDDTGTTTLSEAPIGTPLSSSARTIQTGKYVFRSNAFTPSVPLFMMGQAFTSTGNRAIYKGDTVWYSAVSASGCVTTSTENVWGIGRTKDEYSYACGNTSGYTRYRLLEFKGAPFVRDSLVVIGPTAVRPGVKAAGILPESVLPRGFRVLYKGKTGAFDANGKRALVPAR